MYFVVSSFHNSNLIQAGYVLANALREKTPCYSYQSALGFKMVGNSKRICVGNYK